METCVKHISPAFWASQNVNVGPVSGLSEDVILSKDAFEMMLVHIPIPAC